jgi:hypothetical protein
VRDVGEGAHLDFCGGGSMNCSVYAEGKSQDDRRLRGPGWKLILVYNSPARSASSSGSPLPQYAASPPPPASPPSRIIRQAMAPCCCSRAHMPSDSKGRRVRAGGREAHEREGAAGGGSPGEDWGGEHGRGLGRGGDSAAASEEPYEEEKWRGTGPVRVFTGSCSLLYDTVRK